MFGFQNFKDRIKSKFISISTFFCFEFRVHFSFWHSSAFRVEILRLEVGKVVDSWETRVCVFLAAIHGRHGEAPIPVLAPSTPGDCFYVALEAFRIALKYMTPVILLSDGALANGAEPWMLPDFEALPELKKEFRTESQNYAPYVRDLNTLSGLGGTWHTRPGAPNRRFRKRPVHRRCELRSCES